MIERTGLLASGVVVGWLAVSSVGAGRAATVDEAYAVVSLVGDELSIVTYQPSVGSVLDKNIRQALPMPDAHFDRLAGQVAVSTIRHATPDAAAQAIEVANGASFGDATALFATDGTLPALLTAVKPSLQRPDTHYLVVISKYRSDAHLRTDNGAIGSGKLTGLGFYIDAVKRMKSTNTGERGRGFVAPFAYVMVSLVDLRTGEVVGSKQEVESATRANVGPQSTLDPWEAMTAERKVQLLDRLLAQAVRRSVAQLVSPLGSQPVQQPATPIGAKDAPST